MCKHYIRCMVKALFYIFCLTAICFTACTEKKEQTVRVSFSAYAAQGIKVYLSRVAYTDEKRQIVDSATVTNMSDSIIFNVPREPDRIYELQIRNTYKKFYFIADAPYIRIKANNANGKYTVDGSAASLSLKNFRDGQLTTKKSIRRLETGIDSLRKAGKENEKSIALISQQVKDSLAVLQSRNYAFADTVQSPAAFIAVYNELDFGDSIKQLQQFITRAAARFNQYSTIQVLKAQVDSTADIYEKEFNIGDTLPVIALPDDRGNNFSTATLAGKYYLLDFWSTWCTRCRIYEPYKQLLKQKLTTDKFEIVSVALDNHFQDWHRIIAAQNSNWVQLIDEKMWRGTAANTLKFDSIPFNFLVSPKGIILAKAIKPDSLENVVFHFVK